MSEAAAREAAEAVARRSYGKLVALLAARTRDVGGGGGRARGRVRVGARRLAEQAACRACPEAWLLTVARRKVIDADRRRRSREEGVDHLQLLADELEAAAPGATRHPRRASRADVRVRAPGDRPGDPRAAHPPDDPRLRRRGDRLGLPRLAGRRWASGSCARRTRSARPASRSRCPSREELAPSASTPCSRRSTPRSPRAGPIPAGTEARRRNLAEEGIWLGRLVATLLPRGARGARAARAHALRAGAARRAPRRGGEYVPLAEQDPDALGRAR